MTPTSHFAGGRRRKASLRAAAWSLVPVAALAVALTGCGKREKTAREAVTPAPDAGAPAAESATPPAIRETAQAGLPPFSGTQGARDAAVDDRGRLWVADSGHSAIRVFDANGGYLGGWGGRGGGQYQLKDPCGIAIRGTTVYVADTWNGRVQRFSPPSGWEAKIPTAMYGPRGIAVAPDGKIWLADTGNDRILICDSALSDTKPVGAKGSGPEQFAGPIGIAAGKSGRVYVADAGNRRIQVLDPEGRFRARWKFNGWGPNTEPYLEVDAAENLYATDPAGRAVVKLDRAGREARRWTQDDSGKKLLKPTGLALDAPNRRLYVVDSGDDTIAIISLTTR